MNIYALKGHLVKVTSNSGDWGRKSDQEQVKRLLQWQKAYTIEYTRVGSSSTRVALQEFPGEEFNSVNFEDVYETDHSNDFLHPDWVMWNRPLTPREEDKLKEHYEHDSQKMFKDINGLFYYKEEHYEHDSQKMFKDINGLFCYKEEYVKGLEQRVKELEQQLNLKEINDGINDHDKECQTSLQRWRKDLSSVGRDSR